MPKPILPRLHRILTGTALVLVVGLGLASNSGGADLDLSIRDSDLEPAVTLRESAGATVQEYRVNQRIYQVKVTPAVGAPYYLVDEDGSGDMAWHRGETHNASNVPQWALLSW